MIVTRRDFLKYCSSLAGVLGLGSFELKALAEGLRNPTAPAVLWLQGAGCTGCSVSLLNHISTTAPHDAADLLINTIDLGYHPNLMASAGQSAINAARAVYEAGNYVLVVEGGVPTAFDGAPCFAWTDNGIDVTFWEAVHQLGERAAAIICVGECSAFGGIWAAPPNPTGIQSVSAVTGRTTINVAGCPPHPNWIVWVIAQYLAGSTINLDAYGRPTALYGNSLRIHSHCPLRETEEASQFGQEGRCLEELGCRGPSTYANCYSLRWNNGVNWCIGAGGPCIGCTSPTFPGTQAFYAHGDD